MCLPEKFELFPLLCYCYRVNSARLIKRLLLQKERVNEGWGKMFVMVQRESWGSISCALLFRFIILG
jgi:hypothetical protein